MDGSDGHGRQAQLAGAVVLALTGVGLLLVGTRSRGPAAAPLPSHLYVGVTARQLGSAVQAPGSSRPSSPAPAPAPAVAGAGPGRVSVPSLGIDAPWVGERFSQGNLDIPADVHQVGLSLAGGQPDGPAGTVLLASHVNYAGQGAGVFASLYQIQPGALVVLTDLAGRASRWRVTSLDDPRKADLPAGLFTATGPRRLALITCGGRVIGGQYERNIVATAIPEESWTGT